MTTLAYGTAVSFTNPNGVTTRGVVVEPEMGDDMIEVFLGTLEDYESGGEWDTESDNRFWLARREEISAHPDLVKE
jgi:hypothetical protein